MAISRVQAGSCARKAQALAQQKRRSMSLTTLTREIQSGSGLSSYSDQILVIPSEVEESLAVLNGRADALVQIRDVSTPLDMTQDGHDASRSSVSRNRIDRVSLFVGRSRWRIGLYRDDDTLRACADSHSSDCACP